MAVYAFVSTSYPRHPGDPGGHFVRAEAQRRAAEGHEVHVVCPGVDRRDGPVTVWGCGGGEAFGWPGVLARLGDRPSRALGVATFCQAARRRLRARPFDGFVAHFLVPSALLPPRGPSLEVVGHGSDVRLVAALPAPIRTALVGALLARDAMFRFTSVAGRDQLARSLPVRWANRMLARSRVALPPVEPLVVDPAARRRRREELTEPGRALVAVCGRLVPGKRFELALDASHRAGAAVVVVGDGPARGALERLVARRGIRARFVGHRLRPAALLDVSCADLLVHPSVEEGASTVIREARALGVPVVCCASGDVRAWSEHDEGLIVVGDAELAEAVRASLERRSSKKDRATRPPAAFRP